MLRMLAVFVGVVSCASAQAKGLQFRVVDAESGRPLNGVTVTRVYSMRRRRILRPPGRFWFAKEPVHTDAAGFVKFEWYAGDDVYHFEREGLEGARVKRRWFRWQATAEAEDRWAVLLLQDSCYVVPLRQKDAKVGGASQGAVPKD